MRSYDVVVCGAGVAGLTVARAFGRQGRRVLLVDKLRVSPPVHRGELLQPRSLEILNALGALNRLKESGALTAQRLVCRTADGAEIGALDYGLLPAPYDHCLVQYYPQIKAVIAAGLDDGVETMLGTRVAGAIQDSRGRTVGVRIVADGTETDVDAALVVACDGSGSHLRSDAGITVERLRYSHELVGYDITGVPDLGSDVTAYLTRDGLRLLFPMPGDRGRLYAQIPAGAYRQIGRAGLPAWTRRLATTVPALAPVADRLPDSLDGAQVATAWRFNAPTWTRPGLALVGDAAHCVHPMAGQGMNAAIADAWALAENFAEVDLGDQAQVDAALERYDAVRRPAVDYVSRLSHNLSTLFTDTTWRGQVLGRHVLRRNRHNARLQFILTYNMSGLGVQRFTARDRLVQFGLLFDPRRRRPVLQRPAGSPGNALPAQRSGSPSREHTHDLR